MELATPIRTALGKRASLRAVVEAMIEVATTLAAMHDRGVAHRDIKPDNLFQSGTRYVVGDFGLADFEGRTAITAPGEKVGPVYYIAPEMLNRAQAADGRAADVFSFAKSLWVLVSGQQFPLPGK